MNVSVYSRVSRLRSKIHRTHMAEEAWGYIARPSLKTKKSVYSLAPRGSWYNQRLGSTVLPWAQSKCSTLSRRKENVQSNKNEDLNTENHM